MYYVSRFGGFFLTNTINIVTAGVVEVGGQGGRMPTQILVE